MNNESKRDLHADLTLCASATSGPWRIVANDFVYDAEGNVVAEITGTGENDEFIAAAREGWPHAIERALAAEGRVILQQAELAYLEKVNGELRADLLHSSRVLYEAQRYIDELEAEVWRLRNGIDAAFYELANEDYTDSHIVESIADKLRELTSGVDAE